MGGFIGRNYKYLIEGSEKGNVLLRDQDIIIVKPYASIVSVAGNVKRPGMYELKQGETISDLTNFFSGFTSNAYQDRILVERVNGSQKEVNEIVFKEQPNFLLKDGDKLTIGAIIDRFEKLNYDIINDSSLGEGFTIGHSYFCDTTNISEEWYKEIIEFDIAPILEEYWFDDQNKVKRIIEDLLR